MKDDKMFSLNGKVAVITGAASGIGRGCAEFLHEMGASVAVVDVSRDKGEEVASKLGERAKYFSVMLRLNKVAQSWQRP